MAGCAIDLGIMVLPVAEKNEIRQPVDSFFRRFRSAILVAGKAAGLAGKTSLLHCSRTGVAADTFQLQRRVLLVVEITGLAA